MRYLQPIFVQPRDEDRGEVSFLLAEINPVVHIIASVLAEKLPVSCSTSLVAHGFHT